MVERGEELSGVKRRIVGGAVGRDEAEVARRLRQRGKKQRRIVAGKLHGVLDAGLRAALVDIVDAVDVGEKERIEASSLELAREFDPETCRGILLRRAVAWVAELPERLQRRRTLTERVKMDDLVHKKSCSRSPGSHKNIP